MESGPEKQKSKKLKPWNQDFSDVSDEYIEACIDAGEHLDLAPWLRKRCTRKLGKIIYSAGYVARAFSDNHDEWYPRLRKQLKMAEIKLKERTRKRTSQTGSAQR